MPRLARLDSRPPRLSPAGRDDGGQAPGVLHHIIIRGIERRKIFRDDKDRDNLLERLSDLLPATNTACYAWAFLGNHIHLLVADDGDREVIPKSIKLIAGRTGQEYNQRKSRKGAFWEDRYHATAVEEGDHFFRCLVYIDLNMVRAGVVSHPSMWPFCGYNEIQSPRKKNVLIDHEKLRALVGIRSYASMRLHHKGWIDEYLGRQETGRDDKWTRSIAVGSKGFVEKVRSILFGLVKGRKVKESGDGYQLRETSAPYRVDFEAENEDIGLENTHFWKSFAD